MTAAAATILRDLIRERTGIFFSDSNMDLMLDKLSTVMAERGIDSLVDYYYRLKYENNESDWVDVLDAISVRETYFWREFDQIRALSEEIMPALAAGSESPLKIWSAACASGEEPLTIAMALELGRWFDRIPIEIHASDGSNAALRAAKAGIYRERSFRCLPMEHRSRFFDPAPNGWRVRPDLQHRIRWHHTNLMDEGAVQKLADVHVIFCRNVFIYFSEATIGKTAKLFHKHLRNPGYLFLGAAESLLKFDLPFELQEIGGAFVYAKR